MMNTFKTTGVCTKEIQFDVEDGKIVSCKFMGGCPGNGQGVCKLVVGMPVEKVIETCKGIRCGRRESSCPDQLAKALEEFNQKKISDS